MLKLENVSKDYMNQKGIFDINLEFKEGEIVGILGCNGSGKTTLLNAILGLNDTTTGSIVWNGQSVPSQYDNVAFISEGGSFLPYMNVNRYKQFLKRYYPKFDECKYDMLIKKFELGTKTRIKEFSKGEQLKVEIIAGFSMNASLIILDEPFTTLDVFAKEDVVKLLIEQLVEKEIIIVSTHNIEDIEKVIDRCIVIDKGKVVEDMYVEKLQQDQMDLRDLLNKYRNEKQ